MLVSPGFNFTPRVRFMQGKKCRTSTLLSEKNPKRIGQPRLSYSLITFTNGDISKKLEGGQRVVQFSPSFSGKKPYPHTRVLPSVACPRVKNRFFEIFSPLNVLSLRPILSRTVLIFWVRWWVRKVFLVKGLEFSGRKRKKNVQKSYKSHHASLSLRVNHISHIS